MVMSLSSLRCMTKKTIQEGDVFALVCGEKEPKGYIRVVGLGPTPQDIGTPGLKGYAPTRLQMEILARTKVQSEKAALEERVLELQTQIEQRAQPDQAMKSSCHIAALLHLNIRYSIFSFMLLYPNFLDSLYYAVKLCFLR